MSIAIGWTRTAPFGVVVFLSLLYGFMVTGESSVLSTGVTEWAHPGGLGRTLAFQSLMGFAAATVSPIIFGVILDISNPVDALNRYGYIPNWGWAFMALGGGALVGPLVMWRLKKGNSLLTE